MRKEDYVARWLRSMVRRQRYGVYFIFKSMEQGPSFRCSTPKYPTKDPNHRILAPQRSRFAHYYFYIRDEALGPIAKLPAGLAHRHLKAHSGGRTSAGAD